MCDKLYLGIYWGFIVIFYEAYKAKFKFGEQNYCAFSKLFKCCS